MIKYCLPIIKNNKKEVLNALNIKGYDFYEIWLDYIKDLDEKFVINMAKKFKGKIIFLFRRQYLEKNRLTLDERLKIISLLLKADVFLDLDFLSQHEELECLQRGTKRIKLILSYHNYHETPRLDYLYTLVNKMSRYNPEIIKISTFCKKEEDALNLLSFLLKLKEQKLKYIVLGMGEKGLITRIFGPIWGNAFSFTPKSLNEKSASGQLTKEQLQSIFSKIY